MRSVVTTTGPLLRMLATTPGVSTSLMAPSPTTALRTAAPTTLEPPGDRLFSFRAFFAADFKDPPAFFEKIVDMEII